MALYWQVVFIGNHHEQMIRYQSFSYWGMIETFRTEVYRPKFAGWQGKVA